MTCIHLQQMILGSPEQPADSDVMTTPVANVTANNKPKVEIVSHVTLLSFTVSLGFCQMHRLSQ